MIIITVMITGSLPLTVLADELGSGDTQSATEYSDSAADTGDQNDQEDQEHFPPEGCLFSLDPDGGDA